MYGGRRKRWAQIQQDNWETGPQVVDLGARERAGPAEVKKALWFAAMRWRRGIEALTASVGLTFTQWLVLDGIRELYDETEDASIQNEIAVWVELDRTTVSQVMRRLEAKGLVDRNIDYRGKAWRTYVTDRGAEVLELLYPRVLAASEHAR